MPSSRHLVWYCCRCGDGPLNSDIIDSCQQCFQYRCSECYSEVFVERSIYQQIQPYRNSLSRQERRPMNPISNTRELALTDKGDSSLTRRDDSGPKSLDKPKLQPSESVGPKVLSLQPSKSVASNFNFHFLDHDTPWNPLSSGKTSKTRSRLGTAIQSIVSNDSETFTAILSRPLASDGKVFPVQNAKNVNLTGNKGIVDEASETYWYWNKSQAGQTNHLNPNWNVPQEEETKHELVGYTEGKANRPLLNANNSLAGPSGFSSSGALATEASGSSSWEVIERVSEGHGTPNNGPLEDQDSRLTPYRAGCYHSEDGPGTSSSEIIESTPPLHAFDTLAMIGSWAVYKHPDDKWKLESARPRDLGVLLDRKQNEEHPSMDYDNDNLGQLSTLLGRLNLRPETSHFSFILQVAEEFWKCAPCDADGHNIQSSSATSSGQNSEQSSRSPNKRSRGDYDDSDSEKSGLKKLKTTMPPTVGSEPNLFLACPFYKVNPYIYSICGQFKGGNISQTGNHLRKAHTGEFHCGACCKSFDSVQQRTAHIGGDSCRPTRGPSVLEILPISKKKGQNERERWYWIWSKLFPDMRPPEMPWWSEDPRNEQIILSVLKKVRDQRENPSSQDWLRYFTETTLSEWHTVPPEHLPDLQRELSSETGINENNRGSKRPSRVQEALPHSDLSMALPRAADSTISVDQDLERAQIGSPEECQTLTLMHSNWQNVNQTTSVSESQECSPRSSCNMVSVMGEDLTSGDLLDSASQRKGKAREKGKAVERAQLPQETTTSYDFDGPFRKQSYGNQDLISLSPDLPVPSDVPESQSLYNVDDYDVFGDDDLELFPTTGNIPRTSYFNSSLPIPEDGSNEWEEYAHADPFDLDPSYLNTHPFQASSEDMMASDHYDNWTEILEPGPVLDADFLEEHLSINEWD
ncbi:hypothetical protein HD806DRAFT_545949 [Xylariaceae sp. AK1471]|nr:hypothetical protein HD806DRAFT_545949 [Xylariaceae sp. AK1471]